MDVIFKSWTLNNVGITKADQITAAFGALLDTLAPVCGSNREFSLTKTKMEEACFFAKKAMASQPENQQANPPTVPPPTDAIRRLIEQQGNVTDAERAEAQRQIDAAMKHLAGKIE